MSMYLRDISAPKSRRRHPAFVFALSTLSLVSYTAIAGSPTSVSAAAKAVTFQKSTVTFINAKETALMLLANDPYRAQLSPTDRQILAVSGKPVSAQALDASLSKAGRDFTEKETAMVTAALATAAKRLAGIGVTLRLPPTIKIAKHDAAIFSGSPYTRANVVFLNDAFVDAVPAPLLATVMAHELSHIASRVNPMARAAVYKLVGFTPCSVPLSSIGGDLRDRIITNPDTEDFGKFCIRLPEQSTTKWYTNLIIASAPITGANFGEVLRPVLIEVNTAGTSAVVINGKTSVRQLDEAYAKAIGGNGLEEPFHPEEIVAINLQVALDGQPTKGSPNLAFANKVAQQLGAK